MYDKLDALIVEAIKAAGEASLTLVSGGAVGAEAARIAAAQKREDFRVIDGRLQALRRRGLIKHSGGAWRPNAGIQARP